MNTKWTTLCLCAFAFAATALAEPADRDTSAKQAYLAEAQALLAPTGSVAQSRLDRLTNTVLMVTWTPRSQLLKYYEQVQDYMSGKTDGWGIRPFLPTTLVINSGGVVWWQTSSFTSSHRSWTASLDDKLAEAVFTAFAVHLRTNAIPSPLPDTSCRIEVVQRTEGGGKGTSFYIPNLDVVETLLAKIRKDGKDERLTRDWKAFDARPALPWIRNHVMGTGENNNTSDGIRQPADGLTKPSM
jgi:hypothetical protein